MSTVKTTNLQHPSASDVGITLGADGSVVLPQGFAGGLGTNVVQAVKTDTFSSTASGWTDIPDLSVTITPSSDTAKVLIIAQVQTNHNQTAGAHAPVRLTGGNSASFVGGASGSRTQVAAAYGLGGFVGINDYVFGNLIVAYLDAPAVATSVTYKVQIHRQAGIVYVNVTGSNTDNASTMSPASSLTAIEVAA